MKADLAIYSLIVGMPGQWENVATMLHIKLDFSAVVTIRLVFANPVTYYEACCGGTIKWDVMSSHVDPYFIFVLNDSYLHIHEVFI